MNHAELTPETPVDQVIELFQQPPGPWPQHWAGWENVCEAFRRMFTAAAAAAPTVQPTPIEADRGIVICGGGWRFFPSIYVTVKVIRHVGCKLPIQVWYLGDRGEFDPRMAAALADDGVGWIDANSFARQHGLRQRILGGWEVKPFAAAFCPFRTVISLDADSYPAYNPEEFLQHPEFLRVGAVFWPDQAQLEGGQWERFGLQHHDEPAFESGQFIVDKSRHFAPLWLASWMNGHSDYVYRHVYGDKDTFHLCWRKMGRECCIPRRGAGWNQIAFLQWDFAGETLFVHRTRDKFRLSGQIDGAGIDESFMTPQYSRNRFVESLPHEVFCHAALGECDRLLRPELHFELADPTCVGAWRECNLWNGYRLPTVIRGRVLDLGANCGAFAHAALMRGADHVVCVDPLARNLECLRSNLAPFEDRYTAIERAVWGIDDETLNIACTPAQPENTTCFAVSGLYSNRDQITAIAKTVSLDSLLEQYGPFGIVKIDIEGSEFPVIAASRLLPNVKTIAAEWHRVEWSGRKVWGDDLERLLVDRGYAVTRSDLNYENGMIWATK